MVMAYTSEEHRQEVIGHSSGHTTLRPRSPSPFLSARSRSLSAVNTTRQHKTLTSRPSSRDSNHQLTPGDQDPKPKPRKKSGIYAKSRRTPDPTAVTSLRDSTSRMSSELPPIGRSGSITNLSSRRSSRDSQTSRTIIRNHDNKVLISIDSPPTPDLTTPKPRDPSNLTPTDTTQPGKRSHLSPGSQTTGSSSQSYSNKSSSANPGLLNQRAKSWCTNELEPSPSSGTKLETLFEQNGYSRELTMKPKPGMTRNYSNNSLSNLHSGLTQAKRTKSFSNLTKTGSDNSKNNNSVLTPALNNRKTSLTRYQSDTSLNQVQGSQQPVSRITPRTAVTKTRTAKVRTAKPQQGTLEREQTLNAQYLKNQRQVVAPTQDQDSDSDCEKNERIIQWLISVDTAGTEEPPLQNIQHEEPVQTDTAIHIVYEGD